MAGVGSPLLEAAPVQVFDHSGDTCFTVVVVTNIPCCISLDHLCFCTLHLILTVAEFWLSWPFKWGIL